MFFNGNYIKKAISSVLLVMLLLIHSIKLLHTHPGNNSFSNHDCSGTCFEQNENAELAKSLSDCSICNYQLTKDADDLVYLSFCSPLTQQIDLNIRSVSYHAFLPPSVLENRGPPSLI